MVRAFEGAGNLRFVVYVLLGIAAATTLLSLTGPNVDLALAGLFYDPATGKFLIHYGTALASVREHGLVAVWTCVGVVALALTRFLPWRLPGMPARTAIALTLSLLIGPGLLINGILKPYGGRPRPAEVTEFGGPLRFVDWWNPTGACDANCSFMSGEATTAAWMFGPAMLVPPPWQGAAIAAAALFTTAISLLRMAAGGHFFSDVLIGVLTMIVILLAMNRLLGVRRPG
jgi:membrane-associated PAP2 superfamily phosphatase